MVILNKEVAPTATSLYFLETPFINSQSKPMKFISLSYIILILFACKPEAPKLVKKEMRYISGELLSTHHELNGKKEGKLLEYYPDGRLKSERLFINDKETGKTVVYFPDGRIKEVQSYEDGVKEGGDTIFYENGNPQFALSFHKGKKNGYLRKWTPNGELTYEAKFAMDSLVEVKGQATGR
jgi:hypothetical protein